VRCEIAAALVAAALAAGLATPRRAEACGPFFPVELLTDRRATLLELESGYFLDEVAKLVEPRDSLRAVGAEPPGARGRGGARERALYERGAAAFRDHDHDAASASFHELLALPSAERRHRSTWAKYMLGRIRGDAGHFRRVRELARAGFDDELGLAVSSLGQEARLHLYDGELVEAVHLYAEQAAHGDPGGAASLLFVVRQVIRDGDEAALVADPIGEKLLVTYLFTRSGELRPAQRERLWSFLGASSNAADKLAAAAYREARWDLAGELAQRAPDATMSMRVLAKLALRDGDTATAERLLAELAAAPDCSPRVAGERAAVALRAGRDLEAMGHAWSVRHVYPDAAYIAERVLTLEELGSFVALRSLIDPLARRRDEGWLTLGELRELYGRRLMRDGQVRRAVPFFGAHREPAGRYAAAIERAEVGGDPLARAAALYRASRIAREHGLEILGTTYGPDWGMYGADFDLSTYRRDDASGWTSAVERDRVAASAAAPDRRFHYRFVAADLAERAADLLPARSQAFAAVLCHATRYVIHIDAERRDRLYRRYVNEGPTVDFAATFGQDCPEPEIEAARRYLEAPRPVPWPAILLGVFGALAGWLAYGHRRRRYAGRVSRRTPKTRPGR
jgi:hypothetical protein